MSRMSLKIRKRRGGQEHKRRSRDNPISRSNGQEKRLHFLLYGENPRQVK
jgi:hypothetical protein